MIPVLVHGGRMPRSEQLPEDLKDLAYRNAVELTHARWDSDVQVLIKALRPHVSRAGEEPGATGTDMVLDRPSAKSTVRASEGVGATSSAAPTPPTKKIWRGVVAVAAIVIAAGVVGMNEYKKAEEAKISHAAAEAAAKQAAEDQRVAAEKKAAEQQAADQAAARRAAAEKAAAEQAAARRADALRNPLVGTWKLNLTKSKFDPGPAPKSQTETVEAQGDGVKYTVDGVGAAGKSYSYGFAVKFDGKDNPILGSGSAADTVSAHRIDSNNFEFTAEKGGKVIGTFKATVAKDGMVKIVDAKSTNAPGVKTYDNVLVYDKQ